MNWNDTTVADTLYRSSPGSGPIHYSGVQCSGNETHILNCSVQYAFSEVTECRHNRDVAVKCLSGEHILRSHLSLIYSNPSI